MKVGSSGTQMLLRRRLLRHTTLLIGIVGLIAFYPLTGCASLGDVRGIKTTPPITLGTTPTPVATPPPGITLTPKGQASPWKLVWSDEFNGPQGAPPDPTKWTPDIGGGGWGNQQLDYDTNNQNAYQDGQGNLELVVRKDDTARYQCWYGPCQYTSAQLTTSGHFSFTYGLLEARIKILPYGQGLWSAFWLLGNNCTTVGWPTCGEIDIMENISKEPDLIYGTAHGPGYFSGSYKLQHGAFSDNFHVFALQWDASHLYFFIDNINYYTVDRATLTNQAYWVYNHPFHIILNIPIGGEWAGNPDATTVFPEKLYISYVRLYTNK